MYPVWVFIWLYQSPIYTAALKFFNFAKSLTAASPQNFGLAYCISPPVISASCIYRSVGPVSFYNHLSITFSFFFSLSEIWVILLFLPQDLWWIRNQYFRQPPDQFSSVQLLSHVRLFATPWITACQASLSITNSRSSLKLMSIKSVMPSSGFILCRPLLLLPPIPPSISLFQWVNSSHGMAKVLEFQL